VEASDEIVTMGLLILMKIAIAMGLLVLTT
jgi:hypothetical protein